MRRSCGLPASRFGEVGHFLLITRRFPLADAAQVDFGAGPALIHESGHALKTWFFVMTMLDAPTVRRTRVRSDRRAVADLSPARLRVVRLLPGRIIVDNAMRDHQGMHVRPRGPAFLCRPC